MRHFVKSCNDWVGLTVKMCVLKRVLERGTPLAFANTQRNQPRCPPTLSSPLVARPQSYWFRGPGPSGSFLNASQIQSALDLAKAPGNPGETRRVLRSSNTV